jgi:hypothetical protein
VDGWSSFQGFFIFSKGYSTKFALSLIKSYVKERSSMERVIRHPGIDQAKYYVSQSSSSVVTLRLQLTLIFLSLPRGEGSQFVGVQLIPEDFWIYINGSCLRLFTIYFDCYSHARFVLKTYLQ